MYSEDLNLFWHQE